VHEKAEERGDVKQVHLGQALGERVALEDKGGAEERGRSRGVAKNIERGRRERWKIERESGERDERNELSDGLHNGTVAYMRGATSSLSSTLEARQP
jgi:hypothetical protein